MLLTPISAELYLLHGAGDVMSLGGIVQCRHRDVEGSGSWFNAKVTITNQVKSSLEEEIKKIIKRCV